MPSNLTRPDNPLAYSPAKVSWATQSYVGRPPARLAVAFVMLIGFTATSLVALSLVITVPTKVTGTGKFLSEHTAELSFSARDGKKLAPGQAVSLRRDGSSGAELIAGHVLDVSAGAHPRAHVLFTGSPAVIGSPVSGEVLVARERLARVALAHIQE